MVNVGPMYVAILDLRCGNTEICGVSTHLAKPPQFSFHVTDCHVTNDKCLQEKCCINIIKCVQNIPSLCKIKYSILFKIPKMIKIQVCISFVYKCKYNFKTM